MQNKKKANWGSLARLLRFFVARLQTFHFSIAFCPYCGCFLGNGQFDGLYSVLG